MPINGLTIMSLTAKFIYYTHLFFFSTALKLTLIKQQETLMIVTTKTQLQIL